MQERCRQAPRGKSRVCVYPEEAVAPYAITFQFGEEVVCQLGIPRDDKCGRLALVAQLSVFGRPLRCSANVDRRIGHRKCQIWYVFLRACVLLRERV